ncbi:hypothetical protein EG328_011672 [Venturia inaequalis]|uniref:Uncharacterized protein n=1 Tax=Venturia inaequalis TaxID=5025 RepID=A0A8H3VQ70_VENIN|nr:hypothetical protein EG328_011672 [Venturia inaequalis]KAE9994502.1 hypothetical protein EG327_009180 [Venturia inaequalis]
MSGLRAFSFEAVGGKTSFGATYRGTHIYLETKSEEWYESLDKSKKQKSILSQGRQHILGMALDCVPGHESTMLEELRTWEADISKEMFNEEKEEGALPEEIAETAKPQRSSPMGRDTAADSEVVVAI